MLGLVCTVAASGSSDLARSVPSVTSDTCPMMGNPLGPGTADTDLMVNGMCMVNGGSYTYRNINIVAGGTLQFTDAPIVLNAANIIIENQGTMRAGSVDGSTGVITPITGPLEIHLWGADTDPGATCKSDNKNQCGIPDPIWTSNTLTMNPTSCKLVGDIDPGNPGLRLPGGVNDCFYPYEALDPADKATNPGAYFGHKVIAVSFGGTLQLFGKRGAVYAPATSPCDPSLATCSGTSWANLNGSLKPAATSLTVDRAVDWQDGDHIVVTTTDYLPGHSEELIIQGVPKVTPTATTIMFKNADPSLSGIQWPHNGKTIDLTDATYSGISRLGLNITTANTRAAVGLLTRSIEIMSNGNTAADVFPAPPTDGSTGYFFGGHTLVRQGFQTYQVQGVEFHQLGQGGQIMHYPVHFHMDRQTPQVSGQPAAFVKDSSIWDSMTRWIVLHATQGVLLARNVGYQSIGHGFYLEDGTETGNQLFSNLGVFARAAVANAQNPRRVPGILTANDPACKGPLSGPCVGYDKFPFYSDSNHPADFWIMNGWNDFEYNFAAGAGTCGACYWFVPGAISGPSRMENWFGYASEQRSILPNADDPQLGFDERAGTTPLQRFVGNTCTSAMNSFQEVGNSASCQGVNFVTSGAAAKSTLQMLPSDRAIANFPQVRATDTYWPIVGGGGRQATRCPAADSGDANADCSASGDVNLCSPGSEDNCDVTVLDGYTTSFNWAQKNFSAIWMRPFWSLVIDSVITDPQAAGLNFVTSGDYSKAAVPDGFWALARKSVFIGSTQWKNPQSDLQNNPYASNAGPFNPFADGDSKGLKCGPDPFSGGINNLYCLSVNDGISMQLETFTNFQRLFSVYDGPTYQDSNAFLNIQPTYLTTDGTIAGKALPGCTPNTCPEGAKDCNPCANVGFKDTSLFGVKADQMNNRCYLPNAAIGWKQSNGFYYAPAFHSTNLYFDGVQIRHFVTEPLFTDGLLSFETNLKGARKDYCRYQSNMFNNFTDIDRETVLNDDDGTLTGLTSPVYASNPMPIPKTETISVNKEAFFDAPSETPECASDLALNAKADAKCAPNTAKTSPYQYVSTVVFPECGLTAPPPDKDHPLSQCMDGEGRQTWGSACSSSPLGDPILGCGGVPLYRQLITSKEQVGLAQVKRMMGQNDFQRSGLTVNNGIYYVDTTLSRDAQKDAKASSYNVFTADQKYDLYFLYTNQFTKQTYQMFVGKNLPGCPTSPTFGTSNVKFGYVDITTNAYKFGLAKPSGDPNKDKNVGDLPVGWTSNYDCKSGILTLSTDMTSLADDYDLSKDTRNRMPQQTLGQTRCQPQTMCTWNGTANQCQCNPSNPYFNLCSQTNPSMQTVCSWAVKDIDCPDRGCPSFQITFPSSEFFEAKDQKERPMPDVYGFADIGPSKSFNWNIGFNLESSGISGKDCNYTSQPPLQACLAPKRHPKPRELEGR